MGRIAASILAADFATLGDEVRAVADAGVDWIHVDVMDGHFVPNLTIGPPVVEAIRKCTTLPLDVHLMITNPDRYIGAFASAGASYLSVHQETCLHLHAVVQQIRKANVKPAVVLNPATPVSTLDGILGDVEMVLVMTVNPGFGGQALIDSAVDKLSALRAQRESRKLGFVIEVDGGVKVDNAGRVHAAGADVLVVGTEIFHNGEADAAKKYAKIVGALRAAMASEPAAAGRARRVS